MAGLVLLVSVRCVSGHASCTLADFYTVEVIYISSSLVIQFHRHRHAARRRTSNHGRMLLTMMETKQRAAKRTAKASFSEPQEPPVRCKLTAKETTLEIQQRPIVSRIVLLSAVSFKLCIFQRAVLRNSIRE